jgi:hypothetical protein
VRPSANPHSLTPQPGWWDQLCYQFAHEFCHVTQNHDRLAEARAAQWFHVLRCRRLPLYVVDVCVLLMA